jgi:hypothetical protein
LGTVAAFDSLSNASDPFSYTLDAATPDGHLVEITVEITADGFYSEEEITWLVGTPTTVFFDDMETGTGNWVENDGRWGLTSSKYHSAGNSYTDSPSGDYPNSVNTWIELASAIDLTNAVWAGVSFWQWFSTESGYDYCYVEASDDGGTTWQQVGPRYHGTIGPWVEVELPLADFVGTPDFKLRFRLQSDTYVRDDGWYVDDVAIKAAGMGNARPTAPALDGPSEGSTVGSAPALSVVNASDADPGDVLTYGFTVYTDEFCTTVVTSTSGVAEGVSTTEWTVDTPLSDGIYWWRSYADDGTERGPLMAASSFTVDTTYADGDEVTVLALNPGRPNPFWQETEIAFELPARVDVEMAVYGIDGRLVKVLSEGIAGPGHDSVVWDGHDRHGNRVANGLYFVLLRAGDEVRRGKLVVLRQ